MDYIGSKVKLVKWIFDIIGQEINHTDQICFLDACSGAGSISRKAVQLGYNVVVSNDIMSFPSVIIKGSIGHLNTEQVMMMKSEIVRLNALPGIDGFFFTHFCDMSNPPRLYFTRDNARKIDHVRQEIDRITDDKVRDYILYCGLEALSRVSNTTGVQAAFLKTYKSRSLGVFTLREELIIPGHAEAFTGDILRLFHSADFRQKIKEDVLYVDPPYNHRQYGPNYHIYETFVRNDNPPCLGVSGLRDWGTESKSVFCSRKECLAFLKDIVAATTARVIFLSYSSDGIMTKDDICTEFKIPERDIFEYIQRRYKADTSDGRQYNDKDLVEYLFIIRK